MATIISFGAAPRPSTVLPHPSDETPQELSFRKQCMQIIHDNLHSPVIARLEKQNACLRAELARLKGTSKRGEV